MNQTENSIPQQKRIIYIDWLRVIAIFIVFVFHTLKFFDSTPWHVKNAQQSEALTLIIIYISTWIMPFFFLLSGAGSSLALRSRTKGRFIWDRFKRLMIPYFFSLVLIIPPQKYLEALFYSRFNGSYFEFLDNYIPYVFNVRIPVSLGWLGHLGYHVWFLAFLFIFSALALPLFHFLQTEKGGRVLSSLASICEKPFGLFLFIVPIAVVNLSMRAAFPQYLHWADFLYFFLFFICGYIFFTENKFQGIISKNNLAALILGVLCLFFYLYSAPLNPYLHNWLENPSYSLGYLAFQFVSSVNTFVWIIFFIGLGIRFLRSSHRWLSYLNEAVLPFYVLHQTIILVIGFYIVKLNQPILLKFLMVFFTSFIAIVITYEFFVRRMSFLRFLFGMKKKANKNDFQTYIKTVIYKIHT